MAFGIFEEEVKAARSNVGEINYVSLLYNSRGMPRGCPGLSAFLATTTSMDMHGSALVYIYIYI